jgi:uncharacterized protein (DUF362 family)
MTKGISIKFASYQETLPKLLDLIKLGSEIKKHKTIILKPNLFDFNKENSNNSSPEFVEQVLKFCIQNKNPGTEIFIAEGADGHDTLDLFESLGYKELAETYGIGLIDLNDTEFEEVSYETFLKFEKIVVPKILKSSFLISLPALAEDYETGIYGSLAGMLGAFPAKHYQGFFSSVKNKIRKWPIEYSIHDITEFKTPDFAITDASSHGVILAGLPLEVDKQAAKILEKPWDHIKHIGLMEENPTIIREKRTLSAKEEASVNYINSSIQK